MENFLIILGIYLISLLIIFITNYIKWISNKDSTGTTINDLHSWMSRDEEYIILCYFPPTTVLISIMYLFQGLLVLFSKTIGKINIR